jgi:hypothetical protein
MKTTITSFTAMTDSPRSVAICLVLILCFASVTLADDFKTIDGKEHKNVKVSRVEPDGIVISFSGGIVKIPFAELSEELQRKYNYDPETAKQFAADVAEKQLELYTQTQSQKAVANARNAEISAKSAAEGKVASDRRAISAFSLSAQESGSEGYHNDTWRTDYGSYDQTTTHGKRVAVSVHDVGGNSALCTIHVYFVAKSLTKNVHFVYSDQERQLAVNGGIENSILISAPRIESRVLNLQALGEQYVSGAEMEGWIVTGSINGQMFGMQPSNGAVGSDPWALINEFQNREHASDENKK